MPPLTRWFIKTGFIHLMAALIVGVAQVAPAAVPALPALRGFGPVYFHLFLVGWVTQMIFGVIYWMFPIETKARPRGRLWMGWLSYGLLNGGLWLRVAIEPLPSEVLGQGWGWLLLVSAVAQWLGITLFTLLAWPRIKDRYRGG